MFEEDSEAFVIVGATDVIGGKADDGDSITVVDGLDVPPPKGVGAFDDKGRNEDDEAGFDGNLTSVSVRFSTDVVGFNDAMPKLNSPTFHISGFCFCWLCPKAKTSR